ncbi:MAG: hypothetical protein A2X09_04075 [Bacteroidetes bacterium GWF2_43_11]|nr:MAG: hypothetical protein A2X09_04075 [Bacteroidetes bacterium GWF2_43_11]
MVILSLCGQVVWLNPKPLGVNLNDIVFADSLHGVITGSYGTILYTEDAGEQWEVIMTGGEVGFYNLQYIDGMYYATNGSLFSSADGRAWEKIYTNQQYSVNTFRFVDHQRGYGWFTASSGGKFGETVDGGHTWQLSDWQLSPVGNNCSMRFTSAGVGYFSDSKAVYKTVDSCCTWNLIRDFSAENGSIIITALSDNKLMIGIRELFPAPYGYVLLTNDGGATFDTVYQGAQYPTAMEFCNEQRGLISFNKLCSYSDTTVRKLILQTDDGGVTWTPYNIPNLGIINGLSYVKKGDAYIVGYFGRISKSTDDGKSWSPYWPASYDCYVYLNYLGDKKMIRYNSGAKGYKLEKSYDEGKTWIQLPCPRSPSFAEFADSLYGCSVYGYSLYDSVATHFTLDGGFSWQTNRVKLKWNSDFDFRVVSPGAIFLTLSDSSFSYSENNGLSWTRQPLPFAKGKLLPISVDSLLYICGDFTFDSVGHYQIYTWMSIDRGVSWKLMGTEDLYWGYKIVLAKANAKGDILLMLQVNAWQGSVYDKLYFSHDYGESWAITDTIPGVTGFESIDLNEKGMARVFSYDYFNYDYYRIQLTTDWGHTWRTDEFCFPQTICSMVITEDGSALLGGQLGHFLKVYGPDGPFGIGDQRCQNGVTVFPNPATDFVTFRLDTPSPATVALTLSDIQGRQVMCVQDALKKGDKEVSIITATLSPGAYFYRLEFNGMVKTGKLLIGR